MVTAFYILVTLCLVFRVFCLMAFDHIQMSLNYYSKKDRSKVEYSLTYSLYVALALLFMIIMFVGLCSSQWLLFALIILLSMFKIGGSSTRAKYIRQSIVVVLLIFVIINKCHLHINITNLIF